MTKSRHIGRFVMMRLPILAVVATCLASSMFWQTAQADSRSACEKNQVSRQSGLCEDREGVSQPDNEQVINEQIVAAGAFPSTSCRSGYFQVGLRLCMTGRRGPESFANAMASCQRSFGRVADYGGSCKTQVAGVIFLR